MEFHQTPEGDLNKEEKSLKWTRQSPVSHFILCFYLTCGHTFLSNLPKNLGIIYYYEISISIK